MKAIVSFYPCSPIKFYFWSWNGGILRWRPWSAAQIVRTGDTAKYLDFNSAEVVHVHHCTHSTQFTLYTPFVIRKGEEMRRDLSEAFSLPLWLDALHLQTTTSTCQVGASPCSLVDQARAHIGNGCTRNNLHLEFFRSFAPGWPSTSEYSTGKSPGNNTQLIQPSNQFHPGVWF